MKIRKIAMLLLSMNMALITLVSCAPEKTEYTPPTNTAAYISETEEMDKTAVLPDEILQELRIVTAREFLSLRIRPDTSSDRVKKLLPGAAVEVLSEEGEFAYIREVTTGYMGYALITYLAPPSEDFQPPDSFSPNSPGLYIVMAEEFLTLREKPSTSADKLALIDTGTIVEALSFEDNFALVRIDGQKGYLLASYLEPFQETKNSIDSADPSPAIPTAPESPDEPAEIRIVSAENYASLRKAPDAEAERILKLPRGSKVYLFKVEGNFSFVEDAATGERGYVLNRVLTTEKEFSQLPVKEINNTRYVDAMEFITLREKPSTTATAIMTIARSEAVTVISREGDFAYIEEKGGKRGYVLDGYLSNNPVSKRKEELFKVSAKEFISLRAKPDSQAEKLAEIPANASVELLGLDGAYARVRYDGKEGYVISGYLTYPGNDAFQYLKIVSPTASYAPHKIGEDLATLSAKYPSTLKIVSAGKSVQGRDIPVAILGNIKAEHHILVQAAIHGREHMTATLVMAQIEDMLARPDTKFNGKTNAQLLNEVCFHIFPMTNPDGVLISQNMKSTDGLKRIYESDQKAGYTELSFSEYLKLWKANAAGVDLNRNFDAGWKNLAGPTNPSSDRFKGSSPGDQPESAALIQYTKKYDFDATISYHSTGSFIYWQYGGDRAVLDQSRSLAKAVRSVTDYPLVSSNGVDSGGYKDWAMEMRSIPSITIETGTRACPLPADEFDMIWRRNRDVLPALASWALKN